ncbi:c-type cytochrome [Bosea sp. TAB14]|uniref:c-type cytochrome n=1 Tax=Bosea sp. TAB14 TaxID=3237481 RepID=UPI003F8FEE69
MTWRNAVFGLATGLALAAGAFLAWIVFGPGALDFADGTPVSLASYREVSPVGVPREFVGASLVERGEYLARAADCEACHTKKDGKPFAGGRAFKLPFGTLYTPNITPDRETGIGDWTDAQFLRAVHQGIGRDGKRLYPAFPFPSYTLLTDGDVLAIKAYLFALAPVRAVAPANTLIFPFNQRWLMAIWATLFNPDKRFQPILERSPEWNRGAYLVEAAGHCGECHSPRNLLQALDNRSKFAGGVAEGWLAYNITADKPAGIGAWSADELGGYLAKGHAAGRGAASGPMAEVVEASLRHLVSSDVQAMVAYLRSIPPVGNDNLGPVAAGRASAKAGEGPTDPSGGKRIFEGACVSCHAWTGAGALIGTAELTGSRAVNDPRGTNVAMMILSGTGPGSLGSAYMPSFGAAYTDRQIADVANFVTSRFGARPSKLTGADVARLRTLN